MEDASFEPLSPKRGPSSTAASAPAPSPQVRLPTFPPVPAISARPRFMRRHLGLGHEYGKLVHPNEWDSDDQPRYDHSFPPLALGGETADVTHPDSRDFLDLRVNAAETELWNKFFWPQGDQATFSFSLLEDLWHLLTAELSMFKVLMLEIAVELMLIMFTTIILFFIAIASGDEDHATGEDLFVHKVRVVVFHDHGSDV